MQKLIKLLLLIFISTFSLSLYSQVDNSILNRKKFTEEDYWDKLRVSLYTDSSYNATYDFQYYINSGIKKIKLKEYDQAINDFRRSLSILKNTEILEKDSTIKRIPSPLFYIGICKSLKGELDSAINYYKKCLINHVSVIDSYNEIGAILLSKNKIDSALTFFNKSLERDPKNIVANYNIGYSNYLKGMFEVEKYQLRFLLNVTPDYESLFNLAKKHLNYVIKVNPKFEMSYILLGNIHSIENSPERAEKYFTKAINANPTSTSGYYFRGFYYFKHQRENLAYKDFLKAYEFDSLNYDALIFLGLLDINSNRYDLGLTRLIKCIVYKSEKTKLEQLEDYKDIEFKSLLIELKKGNLNASEKELGYQFFKNAVNNNWLQNKDLTSALISKNDKSTFAKRLFILCNVHTNYYNFSTEHLDSILVKDSSLNTIWLFKGIKQLEKGIYNESIASFSKAINNQQTKTTAYFYRGKAYQFLKIHNKAIDDFSVILSLNPSLSSVYIDRCKSYKKINDLKKAIRDLKISIKLSSDQSNIKYTMITDCFMELNQLDSALFYCNNYLRKDSLSINSYDIYSKRGEVYLEMKEYNKALADFNKVINIIPSNIDSYCLRGRLLFEIGEYKLAINDFTNSLFYYSKLVILDTDIKKHPSKKELYKKRGDAFYYSGDYDNAINDFQNAILLNRNDPFTIKRIGDCYLEKKYFQNAIKYYDSAIEKDSTLSIAYYQKGLCYENMTNLEYAKYLYLKAINYDSTYSLPYGSLSHLYYLSEDFQKCIYYSQKVLEYDKGAFYAMYNVALANLRLNQFAVAKRYYQIFSKQDIKQNKTYFQGAIDGLKDLINKGILVNESKEILRDIFKVQM